MQEVAALQRRILTNAAEYVKPGGTLVYSTCTVNPEENEENVRWLLDNCPFEPDSLEGLLPEEVVSKAAEKGYVQLLPGKYGTDGFFIARFRRR